MSFFSVLERYKDFSFSGYFDRVDDEQVERALAREALSPADFLTLLSPAAAGLA